MSEWLRQRETGSETGPSEAEFFAEAQAAFRYADQPKVLPPLEPVFSLDDIIGSREVMQLAGLKNTGQIPYHQDKHGLPQPVKQLEGGTRLWSRAAVERWAQSRARDTEE